MVRTLIRRRVARAVAAELHALALEIEEDDSPDAGGDPEFVAGMNEGLGHAASLVRIRAGRWER